MSNAIREAAQAGKRVTDPADWTGEKLKADQRWVYQLDADDLAAIRTMTSAVRDRIGNDPNALLALPSHALDLGHLESKVAKMRAELQDGLGAVLVRGLPMEDIDLIDAAITYWAVGTRFGEACSNNAEGDVFGHVTDKGKTQRDAKSRGYQTREEMAFHCDQSTIVGLLCVRAPRSGGTSKISSSVALYNRMLERSPACVETLCQPFYWTKHGEMNDNELPYYQSPVFNILDSFLCTSFGPTHIRKGHDFPDVPGLTEAQMEAIDLAKSIAEEQHYAMQLQPGDMQFLNNGVVLHTRTEYEDWPEANRKRLLWRLWLVNPKVRPLTPYTRQWGNGIKLAGTVERIAL
ncbi:MAG: Taurine catabolism dioxygenase TauD [Herminiimonas sp.]|nr:Taurine catabolism dioxygenase TauD [Herminiimonas sp.]